MEQDLQKGRDRFVRYLGDLVQLRLAVEKNIRDFEGPEQIVYLADANVVHLFLSPYKNWKSVSPFREILRQEKRELGVATAVITAEYIFSRQLAQQRGYPIFLAAEHVDEIVDYFDRLDRERLLGQSDAGEKSHRDPASGESGRRNTSPDGRSKDDADWQEVEQALDRLRRELSEKTYDPAKTHQLFGSTITRAVNLLDEGGLLARKQFARLQKGDLIRPLRLAPHIDRRCLESRTGKEYEDWRSDLASFRPDSAEIQTETSSGRGRIHPGSPPRDRILSRDAAVLTQLYAINEDLIDRKVPVKVVLITEDEKIHYAVAYQKRHERYSGENFLRRPIQFLPVLNFQEMPNIVFQSNSIMEIRSVIDSILGLRADMTVDFLYNVIHELAVVLKKELRPKPSLDLPPWKATLHAWQNTIQTSFDVGIAPRIDKGIGRVSRAWDHLSNNAVGLNVELLARRFQEDLGPLAETLRHLKQTDNIGNLAEAFEAYQLDQLDVLERQHIQWCVEWLMADPIRRGPGYIPRGPLLIQQERLGMAENAGLGKAIDAVMRSDGRADGASAVNRILQKHGFPDLVIIAAMVAYQKEAWIQARDFGERALARLRKALRERESEVLDRRYRDNMRELEYFVALCQRFELSDIAPEQYRTWREKDAQRLKFERAERAHQAAVAESEERFDILSAARAHAELGTLYLIAVEINRIHPALGLLKSEEPERFPVRATEHLRRAGSDLDKYFTKEIATVGNGRNLAASLYFKTNMNLISAFAFFGMEDLYSNKVPASLIEAALKVVRPRLHAFPPHLPAEVAVCDWMIEQDSIAKAHRAKEVAAECDRVLRDPKISLTGLDRKVLERYRSHLTHQPSGTVGARLNH